MELTEREKKKLYEAAKAEMIKQAHGISIADKMIKISGERIKLELDGRILDAVYYPALADDGTKLCEENGSAPLIVGFHGGGFLFGGCSLNDAMWIAVINGLFPIHEFETVKEQIEQIMLEIPQRLAVPGQIWLQES